MNKPLPEYKSHKTIQALKIKRVENKPGGTLVTPEDDEYAPFFVDPEWNDRLKRTDSDWGYYVLYEDGYASWSPSPVFENGYTKIQ